MRRNEADITGEAIPIIGRSIPACKEKTCEKRMECPFYGRQRAYIPPSEKNPVLEITLEPQSSTGQLWLRVVCLTSGTTNARRLR